MYSREKVEELVEEMVGKGEGAKKDARQFAGELIQKGEEQRAELKKLIRAEVENALGHVNVAKKTDLVTKEEIEEIVRTQVRQVLMEQGLSGNADSKG
jgi:polyhydroxyalkanoate synthesis regulator phasin